MTVLGGYAAAVITALTCQNSLGVSAVSPLAPQLVHDQINSVLADLPVSHIKIGMTATTAISTAIAHACRSFTGEIIFDPVMRASSGQTLQDRHDPSSLTPLLQLCTVLTPNRHELVCLTAQSISNSAEALLAAQRILADRPNLRAICLKGGHFAEDQPQITDHLLVKDGKQIKTYYQSHPRLLTTNSHGTGCTFASAFTALHARHASYQEAFAHTVAFMTNLMSQSKKGFPCQGTGPLLHYTQT